MQNRQVNWKKEPSRTVLIKVIVISIISKILIDKKCLFLFHSMKGLHAEILDFLNSKISKD